MIVKNTADYHLTNSKKQSFNYTKPYFIQGLEYARQQLIQLRNKKQHQQLSYSPITKKHTKLSNDPIMQQSIGQYGNEKTDGNKMTKIKKNKKCYTQMADYEHDEHEQSSLQTTKYKGYDNSQSEQLNYRKSLKSQPAVTTDNEKGDHLHAQIQDKQKVELPQENNNQDIPTIVYNKLSQTKAQIIQYQNQINEIGRQLEQVYNEIQTYQIVFDNLCDCYRANQNIVTKNNKLRKQTIRLAQQKYEIITKMQQLQKQNQQLNQTEKKANQYIANSVSEFVKDICMYNRCDQIKLPTLPTVQHSSKKLSEDEDDEVYETNLNLNYQRMKQKNQDRIKKKVLMEPKKLQKGVSFQQEIDVITKYYEAQLSNI